MRCAWCKKKSSVPIHCKYCDGEFCTSCYNLEKHQCMGLQLKKEEDLKNLEKKLEYKPEKKYAFLH
jgi:predicted nucleic acid binding AN1-type Zn finger protein|uniref:AN1-type domain-containing protein n=1 Tax=viral metagenome TaxID=1070528 RepID=A0A6C0CNC9_9ZZZZ